MRSKTWPKTGLYLERYRGMGQVCYKKKMTKQPMNDTEQPTRCSLKTESIEKMLV